MCRSMKFLHINNDREKMRFSEIPYQVSRYVHLISNLIKCRVATHSPVFLTHSITDFCNMRCTFCDIWQLQQTKDIHQELTTQEVFNLLDQAHDTGIVSYTVWGGEPFLRKDISEILAYAHKRNFIISVITNGYFIEQYRDAIAAYVDYLIVSIDAIGALHDELRGKAHAFEYAARGIEAVRKHTKVILNCVVCTKNLDQIESVFEYARSIGTSATFEPAQKIAGCNEQLLLSAEQKQELFARLAELKRTKGVIANSHSYFETIVSGAVFICHAPKMYITVEADGAITSCSNKKWGNIRNTTLKAALHSNEYRTFTKDVEHCNDCVVSCVIETSKAYDLDVRYYLEMSRSFF
jgi:MoaA/NifB/PqqE/SkfB family radical SAM enzyme